MTPGVAHRSTAARVALCATSLLALLAAAALARDDSPAPPPAPNGTIWGHQCFAESRGRGHLGRACCSNRYTACLSACSAAECGGPVDDCIASKTTCNDACHRAYTLCMGLQPKAVPPAGTQLEKAPSP